MDAAVRTELDTLLGYMRACRQTLAAIERGQQAGPVVPSPPDYVRAMTWAQAAGAARVLLHLGLITTDEHGQWERDARAIVQPPYNPSM
jgi:hypothetical protein